MIALIESADPVRLHYLKAVLEAGGVPAVVFEGASPWPGAFPARLMVPAQDEELARRLIADAER